MCQAETTADPNALSPLKRVGPAKHDSVITWAGAIAPLALWPAFCFAGLTHHVPSLAVLSRPSRGLRR